MDQGRQGCNQVDAAIMPDVRRQRGPAPASCAGLQSRQFPAHASDAGANQRLVADESEGKTDQDRREGGEPRSLCRLSDGRGRHPTADVPGDFAADCGTTAAATTSASVRRPLGYAYSSNRTGGVCPNANESGQIRPSTSIPAAPDAGSCPCLASGLREARKKWEYSSQFQSHPGNPGLINFLLEPAISADDSDHAVW